MASSWNAGNNGRDQFTDYSIVDAPPICDKCGKLDYAPEEDSYGREIRPEEHCDCPKPPTPPYTGPVPRNEHGEEIF